MALDESKYVYQAGELGARTVDFKIRACIAAYMFKLGVAEIEMNPGTMDKLLTEDSKIEIKIRAPRRVNEGWKLIIPQFYDLFPLELSQEPDAEAEVIEDVLVLQMGDEQ